MNCPVCHYQESNGPGPNPTRLKKFPAGDRLTARKTDAPAASAGYELLYHPFNGSHTVLEARNAQSRTIGLRPHLKPRVEQLASPSKFFKTKTKAPTSEELLFVYCRAALRYFRSAVTGQISSPPGHLTTEIRTKSPWCHCI